MAVGVVYCPPFPHHYWLVPVAKEGSAFTVSVTEVSPINRWDRGVNQLRWRPRTEQEERLLLSKIPITGGAARVRLHPCVTATDPTNKGCGVAILIFGVCYHSHHRKLMPWCRLVKDEGLFDLEQHRTTQISRQDALANSSLPMDGGILLRALAGTTHIDEERYYLVELWAEDEVSQSLCKSTEATTTPNGPDVDNSLVSPDGAPLARI